MADSLSIDELQVALGRAGEILAELRTKYPPLRAHLVLASQSEQAESDAALRDLVARADFLFVRTAELSEARQLLRDLDRARDEVDRLRSRKRGTGTTNEPLVLAEEDVHELDAHVVKLIQTLRVRPDARIELRFDELRYAIIAALQQDPLVDRKLTPSSAASVRIVLGTLAALVPISDEAPPKDRLLFLDIDGVLAHFGSNEELDLDCVRSLDEIIRRTSATVVVSSAWRERWSLEDIRVMLESVGFSGRIEGQTPMIVDGTRGDEILAYLATRENVGAYVILDDCPVGAALAPQLVLTDDFVGLKASDVERAIEILGRPPAQLPRPMGGPR